MARRRVRVEEEAEVNVTPLLDIVFIMLIFFIVTAVFIDESGIKPNLPDPSPEEPDRPPPSLLLTVQADGFVLVDNTRVVDPRSVKPVVEEFFAKESNNGVVVVSAIGDAEIGDTMVTLDQARLGGGPDRYARITLAKAGDE